MSLDKNVSVPQYENEIDLMVLFGVLQAGVFLRAFAVLGSGKRQCGYKALIKGNRELS